MTFETFWETEQLQYRRPFRELYELIARRSWNAACEQIKNREWEEVMHKMECHSYPRVQFDSRSVEP